MTGESLVCITELSLDISNVHVLQRLQKLSFTETATVCV